jgi:hypothetical protein
METRYSTRHILTMQSPEGPIFPQVNDDARADTGTEGQN